MSGQTQVQITLPGFGVFDKDQINEPWSFNEILRGQLGSAVLLKRQLVAHFVRLRASNVYFMPNFTMLSGLD